MMIDDSKLMAFADGQLPRHEQNSVQRALANDTRLQDELSTQRRLRRSLSNLYDPVLDEKLPESLTRLLAPARAPVAAFARTRNPWWLGVTAMAASLAAGIFLGQGLLADRVATGSDSSTVARGELARALDVQLASAQSPDRPIQLGISFVGPDGNPCRTFQSLDAVGLACRDDERWQLRLLAPVKRSTGFEYQQADSASALVMRSAQELMVGEPLDAEAERRARDSGWAPARR